MMYSDTLEAQAACLLEVGTGRILLEKNAHQPLPPASMTKMMTALLLMEKVKLGEISLNDIVRVSRRGADMRGSTMKLRTGERIAVRELLKGMMVASGNDAAVVLAEHVAGSVSAFVKLMNEKAQHLGLLHTRFMNPHGLSVKGHYASAYDMCQIACELAKYEEIVCYTSRRRVSVRRGKNRVVWLRNTNTLVGKYTGVDGLKTGYTPRAKYCLCATLVHAGERYVSVVMGLPTKQKRNQEAILLLRYATGREEKGIR
jgi:D-alanyl-D-alanine carboxypeptidase